MNEALEFYKDEEKVWHIAGWNYPIYNEEQCETFLWEKMNCWGWATWDAKWSLFEKEPLELIEQFDSSMIKRFNLNNNDNNWSQVLQNIDGKIDTWAVFWHTTIFKNNGLCLNPEVSYVENIGYDGSGIHCKNSYNKETEKLNKCSKIIFTKKIKIDLNQLELIIDFLKSQKKSLFFRIINKLSRIFFKKNILV
jgi:hypothetical protein